MARKYPEYKHLDLPGISREVLKYWKDNHTFEKSISSREGKPSFTFYEGPPSANGMPGIHHVMGRAIKDIFCRFKTLEGYQVKRKAGWDTHGLPVELGVEKELGITKEDIGKKISVKEYNEACKKAVMRYTDVWNDLTEKMGYWVDMDDPYITYKPKYMETVWWLLKQLWEKDLIYKGYTIQPYSPKAGTGLSSHEVNMPGSYRDVSDTTVIAQFPVTRDERFEKTFGDAVQVTDKVYFLAWTTTPWTLPSNTALTVGKSIVYVMVETFNQYTHELQKVVLAKSLVGKYFKEDQKNQPLSDYDGSGKNTPWKTVWEGLGKDLLELRYEQLLPYTRPYENAENAFRVISGDFVTTEDGTGIVHTAPTFGADDAKVAKEAMPPVPPMLVLDDNENPVPLVDLQGRFRKEVKDDVYGLAGEYVKEEYLTDAEKETEKVRQQSALKDLMPKLGEYLSVDKRIADKLKNENKAFKVEKYVHSYPHCWRTDKPILYYPLDSWFIRVTADKERLVALNKTINWKPKSTGEGRFGNWLENANDWNLSRSRYWGIPLPIWSTEDGTERKIFGSVTELKQACDEAVEAGLMEHHPFERFEVGNLSNENYDTVDLHRHIVDEVVLKSSTGEPMRRESDLIDVWFDSGAMPYAQWHYPFESPLTPQGGTATLDENVAQSENISMGGGKWQTANPAIYETLKVRSKELRDKGTEAEQVLWEYLQAKNLGGFKFRRQHIIGQYIVDFACLSKLLIIEVDGGYHNSKEQKEADELRMEKLSQLGYTFLRFANEEVLGDIDQVLKKILAKLRNLPDIATGDSSPEPSNESQAEKAPLGGLGAFYPADFIAEGVDQTRGWFYTLHTIAGLVFDSVAYKNVVSNGLVLDKNGQKMSKRLGNAADPFETIEKYGADAVRWYMITNAQPWDNLKFDFEGIAETQRKFFGTLYNTYSFFSLYANIDGFEWDSANLTKIGDRPELDRWILSRLQVLKQNVRTSFEDYEPTRAGRAVQQFVDEELSNWYVRLCRRRFWKGEMSTDKQMAYETLYECLFTLSQLMSPIAPFFADWLYQNLTAHLPEGNKEKSVHLTYLGEARTTLIDERLNQRMAMARQLSSMVFSLRKRESIKVRQPLQKMMVPALKPELVELIESVKEIVLSEVNVKELEVLRDVSGVLVKRIKPDFKKLGPKHGSLMKQISGAVNQFSQEDIQKLEDEGRYELSLGDEKVLLTEEDVSITTDDIPGWLVMSEDHLTVALDVTISEELRYEGIARELINRIQNLRKDSGLEVTDRIALKVQKTEAVEEALKRNQNYIREETLADKLEMEDRLEAGLDVSFDDIETRIFLEKV